MSPESEQHSLDRRTDGRLQRALWLARAVMLWERGAAVWAPLLLGAGAIAVAGLWGLFGLVSPGAHAGLIVVVLIMAMVFSVLGARGIRWPGREEIRKRLETDSRLIHAPLSVLEDTPASGDTSLWALHQAQAAQAIHATRVGRPRAGFATADPLALRYVLILAAVLALWARGVERAPDAITAFRPVTQAAHWTGAAVSGLFARGGRPAG